MKKLAIIGTWLCIAALTAAALFFYARTRALESDVARLRFELNDITNRPAAPLVSTATVKELELLKKENFALPRLRNAIQELTKENADLKERLRMAELARNPAAPASMETVARAEAEARAEKNLQEGRAFLAENARQPEVLTTGTGLQYTVLQEGTGPQPASTDQVTVHYKGTLPDGTAFDSSYDRGKPSTFALNHVIKGWTEGLQLMHVGGKYKFVIPSELAYGKTGRPKIGPNRVLIFEVELLEIAK